MSYFVRYVVRKLHTNRTQMSASIFACCSRQSPIHCSFFVLRENIVQEMFEQNEKMRKKQEIQTKNHHVYWRLNPSASFFLRSSDPPIIEMSCTIFIYLQEQYNFLRINPNFLSGSVRTSFTNRCY